MDIKTDKRTANFSLRIPEYTKLELDKLTKVEKSKLNDDILITMARAIHRAEFDTNKYLKEDSEKV